MDTSRKSWQNVRSLRGAASMRYDICYVTNKSGAEASAAPLLIVCGVDNVLVRRQLDTYTIPMCASTDAPGQDDAKDDLRTEAAH